MEVFLEDEKILFLLKHLWHIVQYIYSTRILYLINLLFVFQIEILQDCVNYSYKRLSFIFLFLQHLG